MDFYLKEIRPLAEYGVAFWNSGLTKCQIIDLDKIQKTAFRIILGEIYNSYDVAYTVLNILPLEFRRTDLCTTFATNLYLSPRSGEFVTPDQQLIVAEKKCNTKRCYNAPHSYLARLVNQNKQQIENKINRRPPSPDQAEQ
jgi:hypothetical protein